MPERGSHANNGTCLTNSPGEDQVPGIGSIFVQGLRQIEHHQSGQQRDGEGESQHGDQRGQVKPRRSDERLHDDDANPDEAHIDQVVLLEQACLLGPILFHSHLLSHAWITGVDVTLTNPLFSLVLTSSTHKWKAARMVLAMSYLLYSIIECGRA